MFLLIDTTNSRALARHASYNCLQALACLMFTNVDHVVLRCGEARNYAQFEGAELRCMGAHAGLMLDDDMSYNTVLKEVMHRLEEAEYLLFPFSTEEVVHQLAKIDADNDKPYIFKPGADAPERVTKWHSDPQVNRRRSDHQGWLVIMTGGVTDTLDGDTPLAPTKAAPTRAPRAPRATPTPRPPRPAGAAPGRPASGASKLVWDTADEVSKDLHGDDKVSAAVRKKVVEIVTAQGVNKSTASVQFGKWAASL